MIYMGIFGVIVGIITHELGVGWYDGNIPVAIACNVGPTVLFAIMKAGLTP